MIIQAQIINAFVDNNTGGNPAGVVLNADRLTNEQKLKIASSIGLSETAFVSTSDIADFKLDFFTPVKQIPHCGHATIATFSYLRQIGKLNRDHLTKETIDGTRAIVLDGDLAYMEQKAPAYLNPGVDAISIVKSLGLNEVELVKEAPVLIVNTGNAFAIIPVAAEDILKRIQPDFEWIANISEQYDLVGYYVFSSSSATERDAEARMFAPGYGIQEEAATGMAAGPLACYLFDILKVKKERYHISQGRYMAQPSPSLIIVDLITAGGKIEKLMVGGEGVSMKELCVEI